MHLETFEMMAMGPVLLAMERQDALVNQILHHKRERMHSRHLLEEILRQGAPALDDVVAAQVEAEPQFGHEGELDGGAELQEVEHGVAVVQAERVGAVQHVARFEVDLATGAQEAQRHALVFVVRRRARRGFVVGFVFAVLVRRLPFVVAVAFREDGRHVRVV